MDDIEGMLSKFIPPDYYTDEKKFLERVEHDALNFKPFGKKIYSYTRAATTLTKGKNVAISQVLNPEDEETVDFEVYHVSNVSGRLAVVWYAEWGHCMAAHLRGVAWTLQRCKPSCIQNAAEWRCARVALLLLRPGSVRPLERCF